LPRQSLAFARRTGLNVKAVGSFLPGLTARAFEKFGFSTAQLVMDWPTIVGKEVALLSVPERLKWPPRPERDTGGGDTGGAAAEPERQRRGATLVLRVEGARALDIHYQSRQILERVNAHFGYAAVTELRLVQAPLPAHTAHLAASPAARARSASPASVPEVAGIADAGLREALRRLGAHLHSAR
jgi:hypothetical protein